MTGSEDREVRRHGGARWWYVLLALPFVALLIPAIYASDGPRLFGFPFFYWYQFAWVIVAALLTVVVYRVTKQR
jgi:uncharacterized membrane protein YhdT